MPLVSVIQAPVIDLTRWLHLVNESVTSGKSSWSWAVIDTKCNVDHIGEL